MQIMTGKSVVFPGLKAEREEEEISDHLKGLMDLRVEFMKNEFARKIDDSEKRAVPGYMDEVYEEGEIVLFQEKEEKEWKKEK